ncbi:hypothetical protein HPB52_005091 [Rhipicephalus sanguineus]|uniref:Uncharacterized protein n=1 Tax=Rhipicephalus sanguineus TaxID=34632 RepID=A0A9D4QHJ4_RHISA|nr:hypothetical protein HPB52_005091 [Rhipicephalus sanguineus]
MVTRPLAGEERAQLTTPTLSPSGEYAAHRHYTPTQLSACCLVSSPPEDRTMPGKSNNGSSKDSDRWKVKAIPFPPSAERRDTGKWDRTTNARWDSAEKPSFGHPGEARAWTSLCAGFREYQPGVLYPRSGGSSPTSPQPTQGGWSK